MYDTNQHGDVYYEVFLRFVEDLLDRWREMDVTHHLTVVFFCRVYFAGNKVRYGTERETESRRSTSMDYLVIVPLLYISFAVVVVVAFVVV